MLVATAFVCEHCTVLLPLLTLFWNSCLFMWKYKPSFVILIYRFSIAAQHHINLCRIFCRISIRHRFCDNQLQWHNVEPLVLFNWSWCPIPACYDLLFTNCPPQMTTMCVGLTIMWEIVIHTANVQRMCNAIWHFDWDAICSTWMLMKLGNFGKNPLRQSQNNVFLKEFCSENSCLG